MQMLLIRVKSKFGHHNKKKAYKIQKNVAELFFIKKIFIFCSKLLQVIFNFYAFCILLTLFILKSFIKMLDESFTHTWNFTEV